MVSPSVDLRLIAGIWNGLACVRFLFCTLFDAQKLMLPELFKFACPRVQGLNGRGVGPVILVTAFATHPDQADLAQYTKMLRNRRLVKLERYDNFADGPLAGGEVAENLAPPRFGNSVESVRGCGGTGHGLENTFLYRNMSSENIICLKVKGIRILFGALAGC